MSKHIQFIQVTPEQLQNAIIEGVKSQLQELKEHFQPKQPNEYLTRQEVAEMLSVDLSTIHNWKTKGILTAYQIGGRVFYLRSDVENAIIKLKN
ncbi:helix-turn-helix domain-containing protein [Oceanihabitans sediminis]|uniref:DNA-binding protein n=1 Tax=Oceanihabitans sediminis TaxID=1812012 RepID=A0A368P877_9FLAO|nr:helix-turn-helix domain-containing protein [Oceanihabitans sediminis]MDX1278385.1 helix-turn-helix domain-containing protein [Oceanihabitans sediminis]RBP34316.1 excisionase family DNA binding protein [Oceanihabitans sediminis]RCU57999.1 DNA-binding protein [Oceanihabitans sediminis]